MSPSQVSLPLNKSSSGADARSGPFLLESHSSQGAGLVESTAQGVNRTTSLSAISALELAQLINEPGEIINASFPRLSALMTEAQTAMFEKRIDDLYEHLQQVSNVLIELITNLIPSTTSEAAEQIAAPVAIAQPEPSTSEAPFDSLAKTETTEDEPRRALAMAA